MLNYRLKSGLIALGLKCGGTLQVIPQKRISNFLPFEHQERAERLFETKGKNLSELPKDMFAKQKPGKGKNEKTEKLKEIARMEAQIYRFAELLKEIRDDTVENVERKQANYFKQLYLVYILTKSQFQARTDAEREESEGEVSEEEVRTKLRLKIDISF